MNCKHHRLMSILILLLSLVVCHTAMAARPVTVSSADPAEAPQGLALDVTISGNGFDDTVYELNFLLPCSSEPCTDTGGVTTSNIRVHGSKELVATVTIADDAVVEFRDIQVKMSGGRGGKGTTLFKVQEKTTGNQQTETCNYVFFDIPPGQPGPCNKVGGGECELLLGNPVRIKKMMTDCTTTQTLVLPDGVLLTSDTGPDNTPDLKTLFAVDGDSDHPWVGGAVVTNAGHRAEVGLMNIIIDTAAANGCEGGLRSAVSFVLHNLPSDTDPNPYPNLRTESPYQPTYDDRASYFEVDGLYVGTESGPLCTAVELIRDVSYTIEYADTNDWRARVLDSVIDDFSYVDTAIWLDGFKQQQDNIPPSVSGNTIGRPNCFDPLSSAPAFGIYFGPLIARDSSPQSEALIEGNTIEIEMSESSCSETTGIWLEGGSATDTMGNINSNNISGSFIGVRIDGDELTNSVNLKGNTLTPDANVPEDIGVCSDVPIGEKGKPNNISQQFQYRTKSPCD